METVKWEQQWMDDAVAVAEKHYAPYRSRWKEQNPTTSQPVTQAKQGKKKGLAAFAAGHVAASAPSAAGATSPVTRFCKSAIEFNSTSSDPIKDPLRWWLAERTQGREHEGLTEMALDIFTAPVSSVGVERTFSFGRHLLQHTRHRLSEESVCRSLAVGSWARNDLIPDGLLHKYRLAQKKKQEKDIEMLDSDDAMVDDDGWDDDE